MTFQEMHDILNSIAEDTSNTLRLPEIRHQLNLCLVHLRRETAFRPVPPGGTVPMMNYEVFNARHSLEKAIESLEQDDETTMKEHLQNAVRLLAGSR